MEQMITIVMSAISTIFLNLISSTIHDKIKNHSSIRSRKSGYDFEFKLLSIKFKKR